MTWTDLTSPTWEAASAPASVAALTAPTSPVTLTATQPAADLLAAGDGHVRGLDHGIGRRIGGDIADRFDHSYSLGHSILRSDGWFSG